MVGEISRGMTFLSLAEYYLVSTEYENQECHPKIEK